MRFAFPGSVLSRNMGAHKMKAEVKVENLEFSDFSATCHFFRLEKFYCWSVVCRHTPHEFRIEHGYWYGYGYGFFFQRGQHTLKYDDVQEKFSFLKIKDLRWFLSIAMRIPSAHDFCVISARKWARGRARAQISLRLSLSEKLMLVFSETSTVTYIYAIILTEERYLQQLTKN